MKILKLNLFQETVCYKKPFAFKVAETYPLPPYSTIIGMLHKILGAKPGEYFPMNISVQGEFESIFSNYQTLRMYKGKGEVTSMPRNVHQLLNVTLIVHIQAEDDIMYQLYHNIISGAETFTLGRNEDLVRIDGVKIVETSLIGKAKFIQHNCYVPMDKSAYEDIKGIHYRLNTIYTKENGIRKWKKIDVKYVEASRNEYVENGLIDEEGDLVFLYQ